MAKSASSSILRALGIVGWDALEPVVIAALATEAPLLVIGPHGSAKTLLLARLAEALHLQHRHYNASLLNFDDLIGFPVPENGRLVYLQTPATIWDAESVFFDEVSRCRPDLQNKLFPIVHERVVQGVPLAKLRYRWAAMNPPPAENDDARSAGEVEYAGAEPLDVALADRFAFIIHAPALSELRPDDQLAVLRQQGTAQPGAVERLAQVVSDARARLEQADTELRGAAAEYTQLLAAQLATAGHPVSTRRAVQIARNIVALRATMLAVDRSPRLEDAFFVATRASVPDAAWGRRIQGGKLIAAHKAAWEIARLSAEAPLRRILSEPDPLRRLVAALVLPATALEAGQVIADSFAALPKPSQLVTAAVLMPLVCKRTELPAATVEPLAAAFAKLATRGTAQVTVRNGGRDWKRELLGQGLAALGTSSKRSRTIINAAIVLMQAEEAFELPQLVGAYDAAVEAVTAARRARSAA